MRWVELNWFEDAGLLGRIGRSELLGTAAGRFSLPTNLNVGQRVSPVSFPACFTQGGAGETHCPT